MVLLCAGGLQGLHILLRALQKAFARGRGRFPSADTCCSPWHPALPQPKWCFMYLGRAPATSWAMQKGMGTWVERGRGWGQRAGHPQVCRTGAVPRGWDSGTYGAAPQQPAPGHWPSSDVPMSPSPSEGWQEVMHSPAGTTGSKQNLCCVRGEEARAVPLFQGSELEQGRLRTAQTCAVGAAHGRHVPPKTCSLST